MGNKGTLEQCNMQRENKEGEWWEMFSCLSLDASQACKPKVPVYKESKVGWINGIYRWVVFICGCKCVWCISSIWAQPACRITQTSHHCLWKIQNSFILFLHFIFGVVIYSGTCLWFHFCVESDFSSWCKLISDLFPIHPICLPGTRVSSETAAGPRQRFEEDNPAAQTWARYDWEGLPQPQAATASR